jgi:hypothetical protein
VLNQMCELVKSGVRTKRGSRRCIWTLCPRRCLSFVEQRCTLSRCTTTCGSGGQVGFMCLSLPLRCIVGWGDMPHYSEAEHYAGHISILTQVLVHPVPFPFLLTYQFQHTSTPFPYDHPKDVE